MNFNKILHKIQRDVGHLLGTGNVASYIPALAKVDPNKFVHVDNHHRRK